MNPVTRRCRKPTNLHFRSALTGLTAAAKIRYRKGMAEPKPDLFVSEEPEVEVDATTAAAIRARTAVDFKIIYSRPALVHLDEIIARLWENRGCRKYTSRIPEGRSTEWRGTCRIVAP